MLTYGKVVGALMGAEQKPCTVATANDQGRAELNADPVGDCIIVWSVHTEVNMEDFEVEVYGSSKARVESLQTWVVERLQELEGEEVSDDVRVRPRAVRYGAVLFPTEDRATVLVADDIGLETVVAPGAATISEQ